MRLIDADSFKNKVDKSLWDEYKKEAIIDLIEKEPTAYNLDKVIEELEERKKDNIRISKLPGNSYQKKIAHICRSDEDEHVIRVVKGN